MRPKGRSQTAEKCFRHSEQMTEIVSGNSLRVPLTLPPFLLRGNYVLYKQAAMRPKRRMVRLFSLAGWIGCPYVCPSQEIVDAGVIVIRQHEEELV